MASKKVQVQVVVYRSLEGCMKAFGETKLGHFEWMSADGKKYRMSLKETVRLSRAAGCWAWAEDKKAIHLWMGKGCTKEELFGVLAHEIGHMERPFHRTLREEQKAAKYERVALAAYGLMPRVWRRRRTGN